MIKCEVSEIKPSGDDGFYEATLDIKKRSGLANHSVAIVVYAQNLTECVIRVNVILSTFNGKEI